MVVERMGERMCDRVCETKGYKAYEREYRGVIDR